jgi:hypothetical protein
MRVGLVGCVATKRSEPAPARDLYTSPLFAGRRAAVARSCDSWFILSAMHGLVSPDQVLAPYDLALGDLSAAERRRWSRAVLAELANELGDLGGHVFEVHAGADYVEHGLSAGLREAGAQLERPLEGLALGEQLAWYRARSSGGSVRPPGEGPSPAPSVASPRDQTPRGSRYEPLRAYLDASAERAVTMRFAELETLLGRALPASARRHTAWWANGGHGQANAWLDAGYEVVAKDLREGWVRFEKRP